MSKIKLYVRQDIGQGNPVVLLHGLFADGTQWVKIAGLLSKDFRVIVLDLLGHGLSPRPKNAKYLPAEHVRAMHNALLEIKATENLTIVGYSMGGSVAVSYSAAYPASVEQLYLISSPFYLKPDQMILANYSASVLVTKTSQALYRLVESLLGTKLFDKLVGRADKSKKFHKLIGANDNKLDAEIIKLSIKNLVSEFDFAGTLAKVSSPTTFYAGKKDPFIVQGQLYALKKFCPYIDIRRLDIIKVDHMLVQNLPKEISKLISVNKNQLLNIGYDQGKGEVLVLLHGIESSSTYWHNLVPALAENHRVVAIDLLGFGNSPKPCNIAYNLQDHVSWLARTIDSLGITKFSFIGHSLGSLIALAYASTYPKRVKKMTLFSPVLLLKKPGTSKLFLKVLHKVKYLPDVSLLYHQTAEFIGEDKMRQFAPAVRSIENSINNQNPVNLAKKAKSVPTEFYFGTADQLVEPSYIKKVASNFSNIKAEALKNKGHNFVIFFPDIVLKAIDKTKNHVNVVQKASVAPPTFLKQVFKLAVPLLLLKSLFYMLVGLLLFTDYAPAVLVLGLALYVITKGFKLIKGSFSLRNEGLSYIGYVLLGIGVVLIGYSLYNHPQKSLEIAVYITCGLVAAVGLARIFVALVWTKSSLLTKSLLLSGLPMAVAGIVALAGVRASIYLIVYSIAVVLLFKSVVYGWYTLGSLVMAYIRGFNQS